MTSIIIGAPHENGGSIVHGVKNQGTIAALTPVKYVQLFRDIYERNSEQMRRTTSSTFSFTAVDEGLSMPCTFYQDDEITSVKSILVKLSDMTKGRFYPDHVGMAFPVTETEMRNISKCITGSRHATMKRPIFVDYRIGESYDRYISPEIKKHCDFIYTLNLKSKTMDHRKMEELYIMGVNITKMDPDSATALIDDDVNVDPHILILHPSAVSFTRGVES